QRSFYRRFNRFCSCPAGGKSNRSICLFVISLRGLFSNACWEIC
ncbi:unnamed protein product, partial [Oikopleura dioica]